MDKPSSIAIVTSEFPPEPGGIGNHAFNLANQLTKHNFTVSVVADQRLKSRDIELTFDNIQPFKILRIKLKKVRFLMYIDRINCVFKIICKNDVVIASGKFSLLVVALASLFYRKKMIAVIHGSEVNFKNRYLRKSIDISLTRFDKIIAVSKYTKSLVDYVDLKNIEVIPNGFNLSVDSPVKNSSLRGNPSLITVGSVTERKGQKNVILALPEILNVFPETHYHIVGSPVEKEKLLELAKKNKVENNITFHGIVSDKEKNRLLSGSTIFVMLSENTKEGDVEGFGIALLEANSLHIPVIGATDCGIEDAVNNYRSGILVHNKNHKEFVQAMQHILNNYDNFKADSKKWSSNFTWDIVIKKYIKTIHL